MTTTFDKIRAVDFHVDTLERVVRGLNGGKLPSHCLFQLEATLDEDSVFRHFDYLGLEGGLLTSVHIDELPVGIQWYANLFPVTKVSSVELGQSTAPPTMDAQSPDLPPSHRHNFPQDTNLTVVISVDGRTLIEMEPIVCDDPDCLGDHGLMGGTRNEGLGMNFQEQSNYSSAQDALEFVAKLSAEMGRR